MMREIILVGLLFAIFGSAAADEPAHRNLIECAPGKNFNKMADALASLRADKIDTINTNPSFTLLPRDGGALPERVFVRFKNSEEKDLTYSAEGEVTNFIADFEKSSGAEFCVEDPSRAGQLKTEDAYALSMSFNMNFLNSSGTYKMSEIEDGLKDGKTALKKIIGGPGALLVPSLTHLYVEYEDKKAKPILRAKKGEKDLGEVKYEKLGDAYLVSYKALEKMGADSFIVAGGDHTLSPSMSPKKMAKIMKPKGKKDAE